MENFNPMRMFFTYVFNWKMLLDVWLPMLGYYYILQSYGLVEAITSIAIYGVAIDLLLFRQRNFVIYILLVVGVIELLAIRFVPNEFIAEVLAYKVSFGALQNAVVFILFSFFNHPIPKIMAERFSPELLMWEEYKKPHYQKVWQEISLVWVLVCIVKSLIFFCMATVATESQVAITSQLLSWPIFASLIYFSLYWSNKRWTILSEKSKV